MAKYKAHEIRIHFDASPVRDLNPESLTIDSNKSLEANFQWGPKYIIRFTDLKMNWYAYSTDIYPWGDKQNSGQEILATKSNGEPVKEEAPIQVEDVEKEFRKYLFPLKLKDIDVTVIYVNTNEKEKLKSYTVEKFEADFINSGRYVLITKDRKFMDPFKNKIVGIKGTPAIEETKAASYRRAVRMAKEKEDAIGGGFDIVRKLFYKQHKKPQDTVIKK
jgi:hypothetical protein